MQVAIRILERNSGKQELQHLTGRKWQKLRAFAAGVECHYPETVDDPNCSSGRERGMELKPGCSGPKLQITLVLILFLNPS